MERIKISDWKKYVNKRIAYHLIRYWNSNKRDVFLPGEAEQFVEVLEEKRKDGILKNFAKGLFTLNNTEADEIYQIDKKYDYLDIQFKDGIVYIEDALSWNGLHRYYINKLVLPRTFRESVDGALKDIIPKHFVLPIEATINVEDWEKYFRSFKDTSQKYVYEYVPDGFEPNSKTITFTYSNPKEILEKLPILMEAKNKYGDSNYVQEQLTIRFDGPMLSKEQEEQISEYLRSNNITKIEFKKNRLAITNRNLIKEILNTITYVDPSIRDAIINEIDTLLNNYYDDMQHNKPNLTFNDDINLTLDSPNPAEMNLNTNLIKLSYRVNNELNDLSMISLYRKYLFKDNAEDKLPDNMYRNNNISQYIINIKRYAVAKYGYGLKYNIVANRVSQMLIPLEQYSKEYILNGASALSLNLLVDKRYLMNKLSEYYQDVLNDKLGEEELDQSILIDYNQEYQDDNNFQYSLIDEIDRKIHDLIHDLQDDIPGFDYKKCVHDLLEEIDSLEEKAELITIASCLKLIDHDLENDYEVEESVETSLMKDIIRIINDNKLTGKEREQIYTFIGNTLEGCFKNHNDDLLKQLTKVKMAVESYIKEKNKFLEQNRELENLYNNEVDNDYKVDNQDNYYDSMKEEKYLSEHNDRIILRM